MATRFPAQTIEAVGACTRALAGRSTQAVDAEKVLLRSDAATLGGLRAVGDRLALRQRWHDDGAERRYRPTETPAKEIFDAIELARLDAIGALSLTGVAGNLLAHPGAERDGLRWLAFEVFSSCNPPTLKAEHVAAVRASLPPALLDGLAELAGDLRNHSSFADAAAHWSRAASHHITSAVSASGNAQAFPWLNPSVEYVLRPQHLDADAAGAPAAVHSAARKTSPGGDSTYAAEELARGSAGGDGDYRIFTTNHDRVIDAAALASRDELAQLRARLETELSSVRPVIARLAKRLLRVLMARQTRHWRFDLDEGLLDASRLGPFVASRGRAQPFKEESESPFPTTVVSLLIDHSGSMRGRPMLIAALTVEIFARALERCGVKCEVLGFTTRDWDGGEPAREWAAAKYPPNPGRLNALEHIIVKDADVPWRRARASLGLFLHDEMLKENIDGEALLWAHSRLLARRERRRILVVVSDGTPMDEATSAANGFDYLDDHLRQVVDRIEARSDIQLAAIGIGHDVSRVYRNATKIAKIEQLGPALTDKLMGLLGETAARSAGQAGREGRRF
jgi:cobaltochelatase CobT